MEKPYHLVHFDFEGETLNPTQANDRDAEPYIYATEQKNEPAIIQSEQMLKPSIKPPSR